MRGFDILSKIKEAILLPSKPRFISLRRVAGKFRASNFWYLFLCSVQHRFLIKVSYLYQV